MGKFEPIEKKTTPWIGLWWDARKTTMSSPVLNLADLRKFKGTVRIWIMKNRFKTKDTANRPDYVFRITDAKSDNPYDVEVKDLEEHEEYEEERLYTESEVRSVIAGVVRDAQSGYSAGDLLISDYI